MGNLTVLFIRTLTLPPPHSSRLYQQPVDSSKKFHTSYTNLVGKNAHARKHASHRHTNSGAQKIIVAKSWRYIEQQKQSVRYKKQSVHSFPAHRKYTV